MKLSSSRKAATGRNALRERQRRDRALAPAMRVRYPQFAALRLECDFTDGGVSAPAPHVMVMHPPAPAFFLFPCPYADCDGEFDLTAAVAGLANDNGTQCDGQLKCAGHRTPDRNGRMPCLLTLDYSIHATVVIPGAVR
jgi:hypothetical protein